MVRNIFLILMIALLAVAGCSQTTQNSPTTTFGAGEAKEISVTAKQYEFSPSVINVNKGDHVRLRFTTLDVAHGFMLDGYGVSTRIDVGKESVVEFVADKAGEFNFRCNVPCGSGHMEMGGKLVVS
jgi:cytochrome c oxidase subunit II